MISATFRFYAGLNDFLPEACRQHAQRRSFNDRPAVKDPIEALGVPHPEVGRVVVDGRAVGLDYRLEDGDRVAVYPEFAALDPGDEGRLRPPPPDAFLLDVHLGALARRLRLLGIDTAYANDLDDPQLVERAQDETRILLTRDRKLLCHGALVHGAWLRATDPELQVAEVLGRFSPPLEPFSRCLSCNGRLIEADMVRVAKRLPDHVRRTAPRVVRCSLCDQLYWPGSHHTRLRARVARYLAWRSA